MTKTLRKRMIDLLGGYPAWASSEKTKSQIEILVSRLFELGKQYQQGMIDQRSINTKNLAFVAELLDALHTEHPVTLQPMIEHYHVTSEFLRLLKIADDIRHGLDIQGRLTKAINHITRIRSANTSPDRKHTDHQPIIDAANEMKRKNPRLSTLAIARRIAKSQAHYPEGTIRNILTPLKKQR
jgi:hypothetical protein